MKGGLYQRVQRDLNSPPPPRFKALSRSAQIGVPSWEKKDWALASLGTILGFLFLYLTFWPGMSDGDTLELLWYLREGFFTTYQSPLLGVIWKGLFHLGGTPAIHAIQCVLVVLSSAFFLGTFFKGRLLFLGVPLVAFTPAVAPYAGTMVKDVWFAVTLLISLTAYWRFFLNRNYWWLVPFSIFLGMSVHFRPNGIIAVAPLLLFQVLWLLAKKDWRPLAFLPIFLTVFSLVLSIKGVTPFLKLFYKIDYRPADQVLYLSDLTALTLKTGEWLIPDEVNPDGIGEDRLREIYSPFSVNRLVKYKLYQPDRLLLSENEPDTVKTLKSAWRKAIGKYPITYFWIRWESFKYFVGLKGEPSWFYQKVSPAIGNQPEFKRSGWSSAYLDVVDWFETHTIASTLWPYLVLTSIAILLVIFLLRTESGLAVLLAFSSLSYSLGFGLVSIHAGYRYYWPTAFYATLLAIVVFGSSLSHITLVPFRRNKSIQDSAIKNGK